MAGARRRTAAETSDRPAGLFGGAPPLRFATVGQPAALTAVETMLAGGAPQALLLVGPPSVGKTTLALDLAAGLLCHAPAEKPCRSCRSCRLVEHGTHQDLHRLAPGGAGSQVQIGKQDDPDPGTIRHLIHELARRPVEGDHRVAVIEGAHRMNEDAQNALLKTLEEPPTGAVIILCADAPERLLPTIRSRTAILRLGTVGIRSIEELLAARQVDPPRAARLARLAGGRPGLAVAYASASAAVTAREEISRTLLDLLAADRGTRLAAGRDLLARAVDLGKLGISADAAAEASDPAEDEAESEGGKVGKSTPAERRRTARALLETWGAVARDLAVVEAGARGRVRDLALIEDLDAAARRLPPGAAAAFLPRLAHATELVEMNGNPELAVDVLALAWPFLQP